MHPLILVVDDEADVRESLCAYFEENGYSTDSAANGEEAIKKLGAGLRPCVIVLDVLMPNKNGFMFRAEQSRNPEIASIPLIAHSGTSKIAEYAQQLDARAYVQKPARLAEILSLVRQHCLK